MFRDPRSVTIIGTGYVGAVTGACLAFLGHTVTCVESDPEKLAVYRRGDLPIFEPHLADLLRASAELGRITFTDDVTSAVRGSDVIFIAVGTPPLPNGQANLAFLAAAAHSIGTSMDDTRFRVVVNKSTVPVGSGNLVETLLREGIEMRSGAAGQNIRFGVASNPEFLREGNAVSDSLFPDRIVLGASDPETMAVMCRLYEPLIAQKFEPPAGLIRLSSERVPLVSTSLTSAETIKYAANAFLAMKIGFANEIANICELVGADALEVMRGVGLDSRIGSKFLNPGIGWGGSCFGKDIQALLHTAREYGYEGKLLEASFRVNTDQRQVVIQKLQQRLRILKGRTVALLGLAFKPDTDDLRDAPSLHIAERLLALGARVTAYDPVAMSICRHQHPALNIRYADSALSAAAHADAVVVVTEWDEFRALDLRSLAALMNTPLMIDGRNVFRPEDAVAAGFDYSGVGRSAPTARSIVNA